MDEQLAVAQALKYAEGLRDVYAQEQNQRKIAEDALDQLRDSYRTTVRALAGALELRDDQTGRHAERVAGLASRLAEIVAPELAADPELEYGFLLHDLGKIGVPDAILLKPGPLDEAETAAVRVHPQLGESIVARIPYLDGFARQVVAAHHERWDGTGYPYGLAGTEIPLAARIFAVVDSFDAMTHDRPYRKAMSFEAAIAEIELSAGTQFDPTIAAEFVTLSPELRLAA